MTPAEIAAHAAKLQGEAKLIPSPSMSNYRDVLASYKRVLNDILVMQRETALRLVDAVSQNAQIKQNMDDRIMDAQATKPESVLE